MHYRLNFLHCQLTIRSLAVILLTTLLSGCATRGAPEFTVYRDAFSATHTAAETILDRMAVSERALFMETQSDETLVDIEFEPENARYYVETVDPPITASLRNSFWIVKAYGETLTALASGESAQAIAARVSEIGAVAASAVGSAAGLPDASVLKPATDRVKSVVSLLSALEPLVAFAITQRTRKEFQHRLLNDYQTIDVVLVEMREITPTIFDIMKTRLRHSAVMGGGNRPDEDVFKDVQELRDLMSGWVILMDRSRAALAQSKSAVESPSIGGSVAGFITTARELDAAARGVRSNLAKVGQ